ncbi:MAG TPA: hypothetical protein PLI17_12035 [Denitromonas sp.]|nr:hypothetical protein [Denitromonas sp.]
MNGTPEAPEQIIYIVDDDEALRDSLVWLLESNRYRVAQFASAEAFLEAYHADMAGCIVIMAGMVTFMLRPQEGCGETEEEDQELTC